MIILITSQSSVSLPALKLPPTSLLFSLGCIPDTVLCQYSSNMLQSNIEIGVVTVCDTRLLYRESTCSLCVIQSYKSTAIKAVQYFSLFTWMLYSCICGWRQACAYLCSLWIHLLCNGTKEAASVSEKVCLPGFTVCASKIKCSL